MIFWELHDLIASIPLYCGSFIGEENTLLKNMYKNISKNSFRVFAFKYAIFYVITEIRRMVGILKYVFY